MVNKEFINKEVNNREDINREVINKERMIAEFLQLAGIDSLSGNERQMADTIKNILSSLGIESCEDGASKATGGNAGNVFARIKGNKDVPAILLMAHMDTVAPGIGKKPVIEGDIIKTDGTTVLGGDDLAGVECILEVIKVIKENNITHGDIEVLFTVAEESGLVGVKHFDFGKSQAKYCFVLDGGVEIGKVSLIAPSHNKIDVEIIGKASHAGVEPEKGINAIAVAAKAIANMKIGRIDEETTANIGIINGGQATNIVCDRVAVKGEARSRNMDKLQEQTKHMKECFVKAAEEAGAKLEFHAELEYPAYNIPKDSQIVNILKKAASQSSLELICEATGGGSDANIVNDRGIPAVVLSVGMDKVHSVEEQIKISDLAKAAEFLLNIIKCVE